MDVKRMIQEINQAKDFILSRIPSPPLVGMITGTGLGAVTQKIERAKTIPYGEIPNFPQSTSLGHKGQLIVGSLGGKPIIAMEGRFHLFEGYSPHQVAFPVRVMASLGVKFLFISSAAGGLNPDFEPGDLMIVRDQINLTGQSPLVGPNLDELGPRFPDMTEAYSKELFQEGKGVALRLNIPLREGVYVGIMGPNLETPAETRFLRGIGADAVGMSTVLETIAAVHCGIKVAAIVAITNVNIPDCMQEIGIEQVIDTASKASPGLARLWESLVSELQD